MTQPERITVTPTVDVLADARNRSWRAILQGAVLTVLAAVVPLVQQALTNAGDLSRVDWTATKYAVAFTAAMSLLSFLQRTILDGSRIPSAEPPAPTVSVSSTGGGSSAGGTHAVVRVLPSTPVDVDEVPNEPGWQQPPHA